MSLPIDTCTCAFNVSGCIIECYCSHDHAPHLLLCLLSPYLVLFTDNQNTPTCLGDLGLVIATFARILYRNFTLSLRITFLSSELSFWSWAFHLAHTIPNEIGADPLLWVAVTRRLTAIKYCENYIAFSHNLWIITDEFQFTVFSAKGSSIKQWF